MFLTRLELRVTSFECPHFSKTLCQTLENVLHTPRVWNMPMLILIKAFQLRQVLRHTRIRQTFTISAVISHRQGYEVISDDTTDIQVVMQSLQAFIVKEFMFCVSHWVSQYHRLFYPCLVGRQARNLAVTLNMLANCDSNIILHFRLNVKSFFTTLWSDTRGRCLTSQHLRVCERIGF